MRRSLFPLIAVLLCSTPEIGLGAGQIKTITSAPGPALDVVLALAETHITAAEPKLESKDRLTIEAIKVSLNNVKFIPEQLNETVGELVNQLTIALASMKSLDGLTAASAYLLKYVPTNPRAANLFGAVLHSSKKLDDATVVLEYTLGLAPDSALAMMNLATVYLDTDKDEKAKALLDKAVRLDDNNRALHLTLAVYWHKKGNSVKESDELAKAALLGGVAYRKAKQQAEANESNEVTEDDSLRQKEAKLHRFKETVPITTADIVQDIYPAQAKQIRDEYGRLADNEKLELPPLPQVNLNSNKDFTENMPVIRKWGEAFGDKEGQFVKWAEGISPTAGDAETQAQAQAQGRQQAAAAMETARQSLEAAKSIPGLSAAERAQIDMALQKLKETAAQQGVKPGPESGTQGMPPGGDEGGLFARVNYRSYELISRSYELYFADYWNDHLAKVKDIGENYQKRIDVEEDQHKRVVDELAKATASEATARAAAEENLRHKKALNEIGDTHYRQWVNLYMPEYTQKMKPMVEDFWAVTTLFIKNMSDPRVMRREYRKNLFAYVGYANQAVGFISGGEGFKYAGSTEQEEAALRSAIKAAEEEGKARKPEFEQANRVPATGWMEWAEKHLQFELAGQFLTLKLTPRSIEFEAWAFGPFGRVKADLVDGVVDTYTGVSGKFDIGIKVGGLVDAKLEGKAELVSHQARFDMEDGRYADGYEPEPDRPFRGELKGNFGPLQATGEVQADAQLNAKGEYTIGGVLEPKKLN